MNHLPHTQHQSQSLRLIKFLFIDGGEEELRELCRMGSDQIRPASKGGKAVTYKGYTIQAAPHELIDTGQWGLNLFIMWSTETGEESRHFYTSDQYATKEEAMAHCINYGQQIIDGKVPGLSVE